MNSVFNMVREVVFCSPSNSYKLVKFCVNWVNKVSRNDTGGEAFNTLRASKVS